MELDERFILQTELEKVVVEAGKKVLAFKSQDKNKREIIDIEETDHNHEVSTIDEDAREHIMTALERKFHTRVITLQFEWMPSTITPRKIENDPLYFVIDEIDGTTNLKRWTASEQNYHPHAAICIAVCNKPSLGSLEIGTVYTLDECELYSAVKLNEDNKFGKYHVKDNKGVLLADPFKTGDSKKRLLVIGYSCEARLEKAKIEDELCKINPDFRIYEGCRASTIDIINIFRNQFDAYIDPRAVFGHKTTTQLEAYDVAAILPCVCACSGTLTVSDIYGRPIKEYNRDDPLPLVVARTEIHGFIIKALDKLSKGDNVIPPLKKWLSMLKTIRAEREKKRNKGNNR